MTLGKKSGLECGFALFDLVHDVMNVHKLITYGHIFVWTLSHHLLESMIVLDQLGK